ncbi:MAG: GGDEF domain-containing protein [Gammaproteobacteria bacterium]
MNDALEPTAAELAGLDLGRMDLFRGVDVAAVTPILARSNVRTIKAGQVLIAGGGANHHLFIVLAGRMRVHLHSADSQPVAMLEAGESVGEMSIIDRQPTSATVIADIDTKVLAIDENVMWSLVQSSHAVACNLLQILAFRLRHGNSVIHRIQELLHEYEYDATIDPLTGLFNRRWLGNMLRRLTQRAVTNGQHLSIAMIDIDYFKRYNDEYGHLAGDRALHDVARCLVDHLRPEDTITRYGGEELLAILPGSDLDDAHAVGERLRRAVRGLAITTASGETLPSPSISVGVAELKAEQTPEDLIADADAALYRAKRAGRDRVSA